MYKLLVLLVLLFAQGKATRNVSEGISIEIQQVRCTKENIRFHWRISNNGSKLAYLYATFLNGKPQSTEFQDGVLIVHTSSPKLLRYAVNDYPGASFILLKPDENLRGDTVISRRELEKEVNQVIFQISYGFEISSVKRALAKGNYLHPANPIVEWKTDAFSDSQAVEGCM